MQTETQQEEAFGPVRLYVTCSACLTRFDNTQIDATNIEEDMQGRDLLTFQCPQCGEIVSSYVVG
jgi:hypothetical protein